MEVIIVLIVLVALAVASALFSGYVLYALAPAVGWEGEEERKDWRAFGFSWGWATPVPVFAYWGIDFVMYRVFGRGTARLFKPHRSAPDTGDPAGRRPA